MAQIGIFAAAAYYFRPLVRCLDRCFVDLRALGSHPLVEIHTSDMRLNAWILGWVQRALLDPAASLFDSNTFHPARNALTGSEHMIGVALQTLPLRWFSDEAVALHQAALVLSAVVLAWTSFALVRWATGSVWAAGVAAIATLFAPWRVTELPHLQLLSVQWIPLVWLLVTRIALGDGGARAAALLALVLGVQLLSSYYLAYFTTLSIAVLLLVLILCRRVGAASLLHLLAAAIVPYALLAWLSLPYLARESAAELAAGHAFVASSTIGKAWAFLAPVLRISLGAPLENVGYAIPASTFVLAVTALAVWAEPAPAPAPDERSARSAGDGRDEAIAARLLRVKLLTLSLWTIALAAFVMSLGRHLWLGGPAGSTLRLPAHWLSIVVPGFSVLRGPYRWLILVGVAAPILAGLGAWILERWLRGEQERPRRAAVAIGRAAVVFALAVTLSWQALPVRQAIQGRQRVLPAYEALAMLPPGPIVEIPWPMTVVDDIVLASHYTLSSTFHWRPTLNGFTGYPPPTYPFLQRVAQGLPQPSAIRRLRSLAGLRFIVVHVDRLTAGAARAWRNVDSGGLLREVYVDASTRIYQLADSAGSADSAESTEFGEDGRWMEALASREPRARTLTGQSRKALSIAAASGALEVTLPAEIQASSNDRPLLPVRVSIYNGSDQLWPGLDSQREGLVELRYRYSQPDQPTQPTRPTRPSRPVVEATAPLDIDMPAGQRSFAIAYLKPPAKPGEYLAHFDLVQRLADRLEPLPLRARSIAVRVVP